RVLLGIMLSRIIDGRLDALRLYLSHSPFNPWNHHVLDPHIGEGAAGHHSIISTAAPITVEVVLPDPILDEITPCRTVFFDRPGWRDVVRRHGFAEYAQGASAMDL